MIKFVVLNHPVLKITDNKVIDMMYDLMPHGYLIWVEDDIKIIKQWSRDVFPQRLILTNHNIHKIRKGNINLITPKELPLKLDENLIFFTRGTLIPSDQKYHTIINFVDDDREKNRECYKQYFKLGKQIQTIQ